MNNLFPTFMRAWQAGKSLRASHISSGKMLLSGTVVLKKPSKDFNTTIGAFARSSKKKKKDKKYGPLFVRLSTQEQAHFAKRLAMILRSGIPIMEGLSMLSHERQSRSTTYIYQELTAHIENGQPLSSGMNKFKRVFGEFCINIVRVGEVSGTLHENLDYLAEELKKKEALRKKVIGALIYPALIVFATVGMSLTLTIYIFPKITPIFQSFKAQLPLSTRMLIAISNFLIHDGLWLLLAVIALICAYFYSLRYARFHFLMDKVLLHLPMFGKLSQYYNVANISRTSGLLLKSDVGVLEALSIVARSTRNLQYRAAIEKTAESVSKGQKISTQLQETPYLFPPLMTQMIVVGERTGNLTGSLLYISDMYEEEMTDLTKNMTTMIEPILMICMGVVVGFIAISIITPIYGITQSLNPYH